MKNRPVTKSEIAKAERSPNYTPKDEAAWKAAFIRRVGKDLDGAYRVAGRLDGADRR